jgi:hypothetical protein
VQELLDEQVGAAHDRREPERELPEDQAARGVVGGRRVHVERRARQGAAQHQRADRVDVLHVAAAEQRAPDVVAIGGHEAHREDDLDRRGQVEGADSDSKGEEDQEEHEVALERRRVGAKLGALLAAMPVDQRRGPDQGHRDRGEEERGADDRADRDVLGPLFAADDRDDRDQRLGHRGADRREQAADRPLAHRQPVARPLDGVRENQGAGEDHGEADQKQNEGAHRVNLLTRARRDQA